MKSLEFTLKLLAPVFYVVAALHLVLGLKADAMLGATVWADVAAEPTLSSQNRFYGVAFALYGVVLQLCARDLKANEALFKAAMWVFLLAGAARLVAWFQFGAPAMPVVLLMLAELLAPLVLLAWHAKARGEGSATGMSASAERNRQNAMAFYDLMFNQCKPREAIERYAGASYTQHNPHVADGKEAFIAYFERMAADYPGKRVEFVRSVAQADLVVLHCHQVWPTDANKDWAGIDIFRFDASGKVVEHWDVLQVVPADAKHANGMF